MSTKTGRIRCPQCQHVFQTPEGTLTHVNCPGCGLRLRVRVRQESDGDTPSVVTGAVPRDSSRGSSEPMDQPPASSRSRDQVEILPSGIQLGGYQIRALLGRGGMAVVYLGVQMSLNRPVAIKVLNSNYARNEAFVRRFDQEAGALASLNHPNIVNIIDKGHEGRHYYFVMEYVEGRTLEQLIQSVELSFRHFSYIVGEISRALTYVHSKKVIHRDIKPSNIMVTSQWQVKVGDFGIAHIWEDQSGEVADKPRKRSTVGTAFYMAPEQATHANQVDRRADVYSLGVTFYKMFTRTLPQQPVALWPLATEVNNLLPLALDAVLRKAMDSYPDQRYSSVEEFCNDVLRVFQDHMEGRAASTSALIESSSKLFQQALIKEKQGRGTGLTTVPISGSVTDSTGPLAFLDASGLQGIPTLGITGTADSKPGSLIGGIHLKTGSESTAGISRLSMIDQVHSGSGELTVHGSRPASLQSNHTISGEQFAQAQTEPAPLPPASSGHSHGTVSAVVWLTLFLILAGAGYLLYMAFNQAR